MHHLKYTRSPFLFVHFHYSRHPPKNIYMVYIILFMSMNLFSNELRYFYEQIF